VDNPDVVIEAGRATRRRLLGAPSTDRGPSETLIPGIGDFSDLALWGSIWSRPGLDLKTRSLTTVIALLTLERFAYAKIHISGARNVGWTKQELSEAALQLTFYAGLPVVHESLRVIAEVFDEVSDEVTP
jgi:4-carboxymuconolactone decarboxylase